MTARKKPEPDVPVDDDVEEPTVPPAIGANPAPVPANPGQPPEDLNEPLPQGDDIRGGVRFVTVTNDDTGGSQQVPEHLVDHWASKGWTPAGAAPLTEETVLEELGELVDTEPTTGAPTGDPNTESQED